MHAPPEDECCAFILFLIIYHIRSTLGLTSLLVWEAKAYSPISQMSRLRLSRWSDWLGGLVAALRLACRSPAPARGEC